MASVTFELIPDDGQIVEGTTETAMLVFDSAKTNLLTSDFSSRGFTISNLVADPTNDTTWYVDITPIPGYAGALSYVKLNSYTLDNGEFGDQFILNIAVVEPTPELKITLDPIGDVAISNNDDDLVTITGKVESGYTAGDNVTVEVNDTTYSSDGGKVKVNPDGSFSVEVPSGELGSDMDNTIQAKVTHADVTVEASVSYGAVLKVYTVASSWNGEDGPVDYGHLTTSNGNDILEVGSGDKNCWTCGTRGNIWNKDPAKGWTVIETLDGDDVLSTGVGYDIGEYGGTGSMFAYTTVDMGTGNDTFNLKGDMVNTCRVFMGEGDDIANINGFMGTQTIVDMGTGDDYVNIGSNILAGSKLQLGAGDDIAIFEGKFIDGKITGAEGFDTLILDNDSWFRSDVFSHEFSGIEMIQLEGHNAIDIKYGDLIRDDVREGPLFIQGNDHGKVDLGATNWNGGTWKSMRDCTGGNWEKQADTYTDNDSGINYDIYRNSLATDNHDDVYIEHGIMVI